MLVCLILAKYTSLPISYCSYSEVRVGITHPVKKLLRCHQKVRGHITLLMLHIEVATTTICSQFGAKSSLNSLGLADVYMQIQ